MGKLVVLNFVCGVLLLVSFGAGVTQITSEYYEYGRVYNRIITINEVSVTETVDLTSSIGGIVTIMIMGFLFLTNGFILSAPMQLLVDNYDTSGAILFDGDEPEHWNIETDPTSNIFKVTLGEYAVSFSKDLLEDKE